MAFLVGLDYIVVTEAVVIISEWIVCELLVMWSLVVEALSITTELEI